MTVRATGSARPIVQITWPVALVWVYMAIRYSFQWPTPAVSLLLAVAYVAATVVVLHRIVRRSPTVTWLVVVSSALVALDALSLALAPDGSLLDYRSWTMGFLAVPLVALLMVLPARVAMVVHAPHVVLVLAFTSLDPALSDGAVPWGSLNALLATPVAALALGRLMRRIGVHIEHEEQSQARLAEERAERRSQATVFALHLDHTRRTVLPWLSGIVDGRTEPGDVDAVEQARLLALDVRDDLYAPGFLSPEVRAELREFRQRGGSLTLRPGPPTGSSGRLVSAVVSRLVTDLDAGHGITITPTRSDRHPGARVAVVPPAPDRVTRSLPNADVRTDPYRTVLTVREGVGSRRRGARAPVRGEGDL